MDNQKYWDYRANYEVLYEGESFYTITPLPYYKARRDILLELFSKSLQQSSLNVLDFGCGDGWYVKWVAEKFPGHQISGTDISEAMLEKARHFSGNVLFFNSTLLGQIPTGKFDLIYTFAVLAHIPDGELCVTLRELSRLLKPGGKLVTFDQVGVYSYAGATFHRRKPEDYLNFAQSARLTNEKMCMVDFSFHRYLEMNLFKWYRRKFCKTKTDHERRLEANTHKLYRLLSKIGLAFSPNPVRDAGKQGWGYGYFVFSKDSTKEQ